MSTAQAAAPAVATAAPLPASAAPRTLGEAAAIFVRHGSPRILIAAFAVAVAARVAVGGWSWHDLLPVVITAAIWPVQEWLIHVFVLHMKPFRLWGRTVDFPVPRKHRAHHRDPWNYRILFIPIHSFLYTLPTVAIVYLALNELGPALTGMAFFFLLALHYEAVHFLIHTRVQPRGRYYERLWRNHRLHHFKSERYWYGVTRLEADRLLGTDPDPDTVEASPTARTLGIEAPR